MTGRFNVATIPIITPKLNVGYVYGVVAVIS